jgi:uncharacterized membrane protein YozB (DUF420 family)
MVESGGALRRVRQVAGGRRRLLWATLALLIGVVLVFATLRLVVDVPNVVTGTVPAPDAFEQRYAMHPIPAYVHIAPGVVYLLGAPFQLSRRFRGRHPALHRRLGRLLLVAGLVSGVLSVVIGVWFPYGGAIETGAAVVFGAYFVTALVVAFLAIRRRDVARHRRWMIRAFAVALGVGSIRIWVGLFQLAGLLAIEDGTGTGWFGVAFWLAFVLHAAAAEVYLLARPAATGRSRTTAMPSASARRRSSRSGSPSADRRMPA